MSNDNTDQEASMWTILIPIITRYGVEFAYQLWANIKAGDPTEEQWTELRKLADKTYDDYIAAARAAVIAPAKPVQ